MNNLQEKEYKRPSKLYNIDNNKAYWPDDAEDFIYWHSEADKWAEDYAKSYKVKMSPKDYLDLTTIQGADNLKVGDYVSLSQLRELDIDEFNKETYQNIFLQISFTDYHNLARVVGHEGRHRMFALMLAGVEEVDVELIADVWGTDYNKYHPFELEYIDLIGQFNKSVKVRVYDPIPMSWKNHKKIRPNLTDEELNEGKLNIVNGMLTPSYIDAIILEDGELKNNLKSVFNKYKEEDYPHSYDFNNMIVIYDKPNANQLKSIKDRVNFFLRSKHFCVLDIRSEEYPVTYIYEGKDSKFDSIDFDGLIDFKNSFVERRQKPSGDFTANDIIKEINWHFRDEYIESLNLNEDVCYIELSEYIKPATTIYDGIILPNGSIATPTSPEDEDFAGYDDKNDIYFSDYHPLIAMCPNPTSKQFYTLVSVVQKHLRNQDYCKVRIDNNSDLIIFENYEGACEDDTGEDIYGRGYDVRDLPAGQKAWVARDVVDQIRDIYDDVILEDYNIEDEIFYDCLIQYLKDKIKDKTETEGVQFLQKVFPKVINRAFTFKESPVLVAAYEGLRDNEEKKYSWIYGYPRSSILVDQDEVNSYNKDEFLEDYNKDGYKIIKMYGEKYTLTGDILFDLLVDELKGLGISDTIHHLAFIFPDSHPEVYDQIYYALKDNNREVIDYIAKHPDKYPIKETEFDWELLIKHLVEKDVYLENLNESLLLEKTRQELINKSKKSDDYAKGNQNKGRNRWERRLHSRVANTVRDYNKIDMDAFFKADILDFIVNVKGETNDYQVIITFENALRSIQEEIKRNNGKLEFKCILRALIETFNRGDVYVNCSCPDFTYRQAYWATRGGYNSGTPQPSNGKMIANPDDTKGGGCKHVNLVLGNLDWMMKVASVINNYIYWARDNLEIQYARYIFPQIYGMPYDKAIQMTIDMYDETGELKPEYADDTLRSDQEIINMSNMIGKQRGQYKKKPEKSINPRYSDIHPKKEEPKPSQEDENDLDLDLEIDNNEEPELDMDIEDQI